MPTFTSLISKHRFVRVWNRSNSVAQVASRLGITTEQARSRAYYYRRIGRELKAMPNLGNQRRQQIAAFIAVWDSSADAVEVGKRLGISTKAARNRGARLRQQGHRLKRHPAGNPTGRARSA